MKYLIATLLFVLCSCNPWSHKPVVWHETPQRRWDYLISTNEFERVNECHALYYSRHIQKTYFVDIFRLNSNQWSLSLDSDEVYREYIGDSCSIKVKLGTLDRLPWTITGQCLYNYGSDKLMRFYTSLNSVEIEKIVSEKFMYVKSRDNYILVDFRSFDYANGCNVAGLY